MEGHCFNVVKRKKDYALLDYSMPVASYNQDGSIKTFYPFIGALSNEEFLSFINNGVIKTFDDYNIKDHKEEKTTNKRMYVVGRYEIEKEHKGAK